MTSEQLEVLNIIRTNPYFCRNEQDLKQRTDKIKSQIEQMLPLLDAKLYDLGKITEDNKDQALKIVQNEMRKILKGDHQAVIVKADINDEVWQFIDKDHQVYMTYYFRTDSIQPYLALMSVDPKGVVNFYTPPLFLVGNNNPHPAKLLSKKRSTEICRILKIPDYLLYHGPFKDYAPKTKISYV
jgi:hypothetical protein